MVAHCLTWQHSVLRLQKYAKKPKAPNFRLKSFALAEGGAVLVAS